MTPPTPPAGHSNLRSLGALGRDWALIFGLIWLASWADLWWMTLVCILAIGTVQFAIGEALLHEASHYNLFRRSRRWNDWCGALCALPFFTTLQDWRAEHAQHHGRFGTAADHIAKDYAHHQLTRPSPPVGWVWFGKPLAGLITVDHVRGLGDINSAAGWARVAAFWTCVTGLAWITGVLRELALFWLVPQLTVYATLLHWSEISDHYRTLSGSRSRLGRVHNWLFHNNGYHAIHHRYPVVPFHQLPVAHRTLGEPSTDVVNGWWGVWRHISRPHEAAPDRWAVFWPKDH